MFFLPINLIFKYFRYFPLLITFRKESPELTPLPYIMELLVSSKSHGSVLNSIMDIVDNLLSWEEPLQGEEAPQMTPLAVNSSLTVSTYHIKGMYSKLSLK